MLVSLSFKCVEFYCDTVTQWCVNVSESVVLVGMGIVLVFSWCNMCVTLVVFYSVLPGLRVNSTRGEMREIQFTCMTMIDSYMTCNIRLLIYTLCSSLACIIMCFM